MHKTTHKNKTLFIQSCVYVLNINYIFFISTFFCVVAVHNKRISFFFWKKKKKKSARERNFVACVSSKTRLCEGHSFVKHLLIESQTWAGKGGPSKEREKHQKNISRRVARERKYFNSIFLTNNFVENIFRK